MRNEQNSAWVSGAYVSGESNTTNYIEMSHYFNNVGHPHTIDITIKSGLIYTGSSDTYIRPDDPHENSHKKGHTFLFCQNDASYHHQRKY